MKSMIGYTFAILAIVVLVALFFAARALGGGRRDPRQRPDYRKGTTYEKPQDEEVRRDESGGQS
jgi:thymidine phosphorylase